MNDKIKKSELINIIKETVKVCLLEINQKKDLDEITTTSNIEPINLPGSKMGAKSNKSGWVSGKGGSVRGVLGSASLGYELTSIGKQEMSRKQDPVY